ncbi:uncharacterized protein JCM6883_005992 [Sporobolomyces salmoneus]|uniref:uncharacterized protein n=1 Tax=Sporobolomyces salmoneus TaxID=183962 RepID=UPI00317E6797
MSTLKAKQDQIRQQLNLKNLQRHDPLISEIVTSASYASVYENYGEQWVKTGVEGPMFLFSRTQSPHYGFFVLNRQGLEYIQEFLTPDCELNVGGEFILFESGQNVDKATGIWIFDESERASLCKRMEQLRSAATAVASSASSTPASAPALQKAPTAGQSVSLDLLFGSATSKPSSSTTTTTQPTPAVPSPNVIATPTNPLDLLFLNAAARNSPQQQARQPPISQNPPLAQPRPTSSQPISQAPPSAIPKTLEQLFAAASPVPQSATLPFQALSQAHLSAPSPSLLPNTLPKNNTTTTTNANAVNGVTAGGGRKEEQRGMSLLDSIFASAKTTDEAHTPQSQPSNPVPQAHPASTTNVATTSSADGRALLAMLGHPAALTSPVPPPTQSQSHSHPSTTIHPAPFQMDQPPAQPQSVTTNSTSSQSPEISKKEEESKPLFAAPLLSHDVFASFPLPTPKAKKQPSIDGSAGKSSGSRSDQGEAETEAGEREGSEKDSKVDEEEKEVSEVLSHVEESLTDVLRSAPGPLPSIAPTQSALEEDSRQTTRTNATRSTKSPQITKSQLVDIVDSTVTSHGLDGNHDEEATLEREEFMKQVFEMLKKPSVQMQLYGRYLERVEESQ